MAIAIAVCKFSKNCRGSMPPDPIESFLVHSLHKLFKFKSAEKNTLEKVTKIGAPSLKKILNTPLTLNIFKRLIYARFGVQTSLHLVNIQPNSKLHPPTKTFWIRSCVKLIVKCDVILTPPPSLQNPGYASALVYLICNVQIASMKQSYVKRHVDKCQCLKILYGSHENTNKNMCLLWLS